MDDHLKNLMIENHAISLQEDFDAAYTAHQAAVAAVAAAKTAEQQSLQMLGRLAQAIKITELMLGKSMPRVMTKPRLYRAFLQGVELGQIHNILESHGPKDPPDFS